MNRYLEIPTKLYTVSHKLNVIYHIMFIMGKRFLVFAVPITFCDLMSKTLLLI